MTEKKAGNRNSSDIKIFFDISFSSETGVDPLSFRQADRIRNVGDLSPAGHKAKENSICFRTTPKDPLSSLEMYWNEIEPRCLVNIELITKLREMGADLKLTVETCGFPELSIPISLSKFAVLVGVTIDFDMYEEC